MSSSLRSDSNYVTLVISDVTWRPVFSCYGLSCVFLQIYMLKVLIPNVMVFGDGAFESKLGLDGVMRMGPWSRGIGVLIKEGGTPELSLYTHTSGKGHIRM